ncbi:hypothetical protein ABZ371_32880 [Streptomyces sp. NPDC005899]|uniref:hypothetical protein n=1 Tax=Streptomyces sp. NPDC005899 TaxID=3155716 RepID=UPI0033CDE23D
MLPPGAAGPHMWFEQVPELISWTVDSGFTGHPYLDVEAANTHPDAPATDLRCIG